MRSRYFIRVAGEVVATVHLTGVVGYRFWWVGKVFVKKKYRSTGFGTTIMKAVAEVADGEGVTLKLRIHPTGDLTVRQLAAWYRRLGFVRHGGTWTRKPKKEDQNEKKRTG